nr:MAG TPA: hypothetical protein [Bacteriophage sp.]
MLCNNTKYSANSFYLQLSFKLLIFSIQNSHNNHFF